MSSRYKDYGLLPSDDPEQECKEWFWVSLGEDNTYPKEFLEHLRQMVDDIESGKVETYPVTQDMFDKLKELVGDVEVDFNEKLEKVDGTL